MEALVSRVVGTALEAARGPEAAGGQVAVPGVAALAWLLWLWARLLVALVEIAQLRGALAVASAELAASRAQVALLQHLLFGQSSERAAPVGPGDEPAAPGPSDGASRGGAAGDGAGQGGAAGDGAGQGGAAGDGAGQGGAAGDGAGQGGAAGGSVGGGRRRGPGARAGRRDYRGLPEDDGGRWDFPEGGYACPCCGVPFTANGQDVSTRLEWVVRVVRRVTRRRRYRRTCDCAGPATVMAPGEPRALGKGLWTNRSLALLLVERYGAGRSLNSLVVGLARHGAVLAAPTLVGACARAGVLLAPLVEAIRQRSQASWHLHADETSWKVFTPNDGGKPQRWWLWVFIGEDTVCFLMDHTRASAVLTGHLGLTEQADGTLTAREGARGERVLSSDFYAVYVSVGRRCAGLVNLYCLAHLRRYFLRATLSNPGQLEYWEKAWLDRFRALYAAHRELAAAWAGPRDTPGPDTDARLADAYTAWDRAIEAIDTARREQQASPGLQSAAKDALATLAREWPGILAHRDYPMIDLDNNVSERALRRPVVTRKNAYGSRTDDAAVLAAAVWTVLGTVEKHGLNTLTYLTAYFDACGRAGGKPPQGPDLDRFLPWQASPDDLAAWKQPPG